MSVLAIFDCDGVLVDSEVLITHAHVQALGQAGYSVTPGELIERFLGVPDRAMYAEIEEEIGRPLPKDYDCRLETALRGVMETQLSPVPGAREALTRLRYPACVASSSTAGMLAFKLGTTGLLDYFGARVFSADEVAQGKPAPDLFLHSAERVGANPAECLVIEDSINGVIAARRANMRAVGFIGAGHVPPGYGERLMEAGAEAVFASFPALWRGVPDAFQ